MTTYTAEQKHDAVTLARTALTTSPINWDAFDQSMQGLMAVAGVTPMDLTGVVSLSNITAWFPDWNQTTSQQHAPVIYFIATHDRRYVKIGITTRIMSRLSQIQSSNPETLELLATISGTRMTEKEWHDQWRHERVRGEWFNLTPELRDAIDNENATRHLMDE